MSESVGAGRGTDVGPSPVRRPAVRCPGLTRNLLYDLLYDMMYSLLYDLLYDLLFDLYYPV